MDNKRFWAKAKQAANKPAKANVVDTASLQDYIGAVLVMPLAVGVIKSVRYAYTRRINKKAYKLYTITINATIQNSIKTIRITAYADTQWLIS